MKNVYLKGMILVTMIAASNSICAQKNKQYSLRKTVQLNNYGDSCLAKNDVCSAMDAFSQSIKIRERFKDTVNVAYSETLLKLALCQSTMKNCSNALSLGIKALNNCVFIGKMPNGYLTLIKSLLMEFEESGCYDEGKILATRVSEITKSIYGNSSYEYAVSLCDIVNFDLGLGFFDEALKLSNESVDILKRTVGTENKDYASSLRQLALSYSYADVGDYNKPIELVKEALNIQRKVLGTENNDYAQSLSNLALFYYNMGNYIDAVETETEVLQIRKKIIGTKHSDYAQSLGNLACFNSELGNYEEAIRLSTEALEIRKQVNGEAHSEYILMFNNLSMYYCQLGNYNEAIRLVSNAIDLLKRAYGVEHPYYIHFLNNLGGYYYKLGNYTKAIEVIKDVMTIFEKKYGRMHPDYAIFLSNLAQYNSMINNFQESVKLESEAIDIRKKTLGEYHPDYAVSLFYYSYYMSVLGRHSKAIKEMSSAVNIKSRILLSNFSRMSSTRRNSFWEQQSSFFLQSFPEFVYKCKDVDMISLLLDKTALLGKGILINTDIEIKTMIEESGDKELITEYQRLLEGYDLYEKVSALPISERPINTDSLKKELQKNEDELIRRSQAYGDYMQNMKLTWRDIQSGLKEDEIAIEFLDFPIGKDSIMYIALTLKKGYDHPHMISLFELKQLMNINRNDYYKTFECAKLIWNPLRTEMEGVNTVYFSPSGDLHKIGIEYLPLDGDEYIFDKYQLYRLSSTRQIVLDKKTTRKKAALYGGIDYDASPTMNSTKDTDSIDTIVPIDNRINVDLLPIRGSREYLQGTKIEADNISTNLKKHKWDFQYYGGIKGTEENFKKMSGNCPSLLHIATHGFYMTEKDVRKVQEIAMIEGKRSMDEEQLLKEDKPMTRSGLLLAGCNHILNHETIPENSEDGILTAQEIASLDLRGLDLVVLSACETGLGDISSGEGVFGLQRGFKKAGANTIIMSLWKVSDKATESLMTYFYKNYLNGMSKYDAFAAARKKLKEECPPRQNKPDWAAFIMLDGIN